MLPDRRVERILNDLEKIVGLCREGLETCQKEDEQYWVGASLVSLMGAVVAWRELHEYKAAPVIPHWLSVDELRKDMASIRRDRKVRVADVVTGKQTTTEEADAVIDNMSRHPLLFESLMKAVLSEDADPSRN